MGCTAGTGTKTMTAAQVAGVVADLGPPAGTAVAHWVAKARQESRNRPECINEIGAVGLWQIRDIHVETMRGRVASTFTDKATFRVWLQNPRNNFQAAKVVYGLQGWGPPGGWAASGGKPTPTPEDLAAAGAPDDTGGWQRSVGDAVEGAVDTAAGLVTSPFDALMSGLKAVLDVVNRVGEWVSEPHNWVRIGYVVGGTALVIVAGAAVASDTKTGQAVTGAVTTVATKGAVRHT